jgi:hypothetical protein
MEFVRAHKKITVLVGVTLVAIALIGIGVAVLRPAAKDTSQVSLVQETGFQTILPAGRTIASLGGWERISPVNTAPVYAFADTIDEVTVSVSQQPLPFSGAINEQVAQLASAYSATNAIDADNTKVYIGTSAKGPQSVIFTKKDLLVLIKSQAKIENDSWKRYISSLQ